MTPASTRQPSAIVGLPAPAWPVERSWPGTVHSAKSLALQRIHRQSLHGCITKVAFRCAVISSDLMDRACNGWSSATI